MSVTPQPKTEVGICPGCGARIRFQGKVQVGEFVICEECGDQLEIVGTAPIKMDWAFEDPFDDDADGDYGDDFDDDFDDDAPDYDEYEWDE